MLSLTLGGVILCSAAGIGIMLLNSNKGTIEDKNGSEVKPLGGISIDELLAENCTLDVEVQRGGK